jgi:ATP-binding cassette subfamily B protein
MKNLLSLNRYFIKYKWRFIFGILFVTVSNIFGVYGPKLVRYGFDMINESFNAFRALSGLEYQEELAKAFVYTAFLVGLAYIVVAFLKGVFMFFMRQTLIVMSRHIEYDMKNDIFNHYQKLDAAFYKVNNTGDLMNRISEDVSRVRMYLGPAIMYTINLIIMFVLVIVTMVNVNPKLSLYVLLPLPLLSFMIYKISEVINKQSDQVQQNLSKISSFVQERFSGIRVIKAFNRENFTLSQFDSLANDYKNSNMQLVRTNALFMPAMMLLIGLSTLLTVFFGGIEAINGNITIGNIAEFIIYVNMLTWPVASLGWVSSLVQRAEASQARINEFLNTKPEIVNNAFNQAFEMGEIEFKNVSFQYPESGIVALKNINLKIEKGKTVAFLGKTGSGKSTLANLLLRMFDVNEGKISINGKNIKDINYYALREKTGYVPQEVFLFSDSIANNISFGLKENEFDREKIETAAKDAAIYDNIIDFNLQFDTIIGERGVTLSGGQKQRISIARAIIKEPELLIFDDCLSAVDTETEEKILGNLKRIMRNKTSIIISHRVSTLMHADEIYVLSDGQIIEKGNHQELMALKGNYFDIYKKQLSESSKAII